MSSLYITRIDKNFNITLPKAMVQELNLEIGDELEFILDDDGTLLVNIIYHDWEAPEWLLDDIDHE